MKTHQLGPDEHLPFDDHFINVVSEVSLEDCAALPTDLFMSLEDAGLEERCQFQPSHGFQGVPEYIAWFSDGEDSRYETN